MAPQGSNEVDTVHPGGNASKVGVVGGGSMGTGIALEFAVAGFDVALLTTRAETGAAAVDRIRQDLELMADAGMLPAGQVGAALRRVRPTTVFTELADGAGHVVESVPEELSLKQKVFAELDQLTGPDVLLASNTTSLPVSAIAAECARPERVLSTHYYLPAHLVPLVDVVPGKHTDQEATDRAARLLAGLGKSPVIFGVDAGTTAGPRLQTALIGEAVRLVTEGMADPRTVDRVITEGIGRRFGVTGVFDRLDLAGLDTVAAVLRQQGRSVPPVLAEKIDAGALGRKAGRGFYSWSPAETAAFERKVSSHLISQLHADRRGTPPGPAGPTSVFIDQGVLDAFLAAAERAYRACTPAEPPSCFAVLVGELTGDAMIVRRAHLANNIRATDPDIDTAFAEQIVPCFGNAYTNKRRGFWCDSRDQLRIQRAAEADGLDVLGSIHLHPDWHRIGPPAERGLRISHRPTPMDVHVFGSTGWPLNMVCYLEERDGISYSTLGAWGPPRPSTGQCPELTVLDAM